MNESGLQSKKNNSLPVIEVKDLRVHFNFDRQHTCTIFVNDNRVNNMTNESPPRFNKNIFL